MSRVGYATVSSLHKLNAGIRKNHSILVDDNYGQDTSSLFLNQHWQKLVMFHLQNHLVWLVLIQLLEFLLGDWDLFHILLPQLLVALLQSNLLHKRHPAFCPFPYSWSICLLHTPFSVSISYDSGPTLFLTLPDTHFSQFHNFLPLLSVQGIVP